MDTTLEQTTIPRKWYEIWLNVWIKPGEEIFRSLLKEPNANYKRGLMWIAVMSFISVLIFYLKSLWFPQYYTPDLIFGNNMLWRTVVNVFTGVLEFVIMSGVTHWVARRFGGNGEWSPFFFCFAAIYAPYILLVALSDFLQPLRFSSIWITFALLIYQCVLIAAAVRAVHNISTWKSYVSVFAPWIIVISLFFCWDYLVAIGILPGFSL